MGLSGFEWVEGVEGVALVAEFGGTLGLFLEFSFMTHWDKFHLLGYGTRALDRVRKSKNFPDSKIFTPKTFRINSVNRDINDFATNARKT